MDASVVIDAVADPGPRGVAARTALADQLAAEHLDAPGHLAFEVLSALRVAANRPTHPLHARDVEQALRDAEGLGIAIRATPWADVHRAWELSQGSMRYADAVCVAAAERMKTTLLTCRITIG